MSRWTRIRIRPLVQVVFALTVFVLIPMASFAAQATLAWDPNDPAPQGYRIFQRTQGQTYDYSQPAWSGSDTSGTVYNLEGDTTYYYVVRAFDGDLESADSAEVSFHSPVTQPATYSITTTIGDHGSISPSGVLVYTAGASQIFTITPDTGYQIVDVLVDGVSQGAIGSYTFSQIDVDHTIEAVFSASTYTITATAGDNGNVSPVGESEVVHGASRTYAISPDTGFHITNVIVDGVAQGVTASYTFENVTADHTITAAFAVNTYQINASAGANGSISPSGSVDVIHGQGQTYIITPESSCNILQVLVDGTPVGPVTTYTFSDITQNHTISASFEMADNQPPARVAGLSASLDGLLVNLSWQPASDNVGTAVYNVYRNGVLIGSTTATSYADGDVTPSASYSYAIEAEDAAGNCSALSALATITVNAVVNEIVIQVSSGNDDAEERESTGAMYLNSSDLELIADGSEQVVGIRFSGLEIPQGALITDAYIEFETDETDGVQTDVTITAQDSDDAQAFGTGAYDISSRQTVGVSVVWNDIPAWDRVDERHQTPDLSAVVQTVVDRAGWTSGNAMAFIISGSGCRTAESYDGESNAAPSLHIAFTIDSNVNLVPVVDAGEDLSITLPENSVVLNTDIMDDGNPQGVPLTVAWTVVSGDGQVTFEDSQSAITGASFSAAGVYILNVEVSDGELSASDQVAVTVLDSNQILYAESRVAGSSDDAEERESTGAMYLDSSDLELIADGSEQVVGIRFSGLEIPQGAQITNAYIEFETDETGNIQTDLTITAQDSDDAQAFGTGAYDISNRQTVGTSVVWNGISAWDRVDEKHQTPDLSAVVQTVVDRAGWTSGNAMAFIISGSGCRTAESYDGESNAAPLLRVEYTMPKKKGSIEAQVAGSSDDAEERESTGAMYLDSSDLELIADGSEQVVGIRFSGLEIPQGAQITNAYIEFETDETGNIQTDLTITAQDSDDAQAFGTGAYDISNRQTVGTSVVWNGISAWDRVDEKHQTPDLSAVVQTVVDRAGWTSGNAMAFIISGSGCRTAESYDGESNAAPLLRVEFLTQN